MNEMLNNPSHQENANQSNKNISTHCNSSDHLNWPINQSLRNPGKRLEKRKLSDNIGGNANEYTRRWLLKQQQIYHSIWSSHFWEHIHKNESSAPHKHISMLAIMPYIIATLKFRLCVHWWMNKENLCVCTNIYVCVCVSM